MEWENVRDQKVLQLYPQVEGVFTDPKLNNATNTVLGAVGNSRTYASKICYLQGKVSQLKVCSCLTCVGRFRRLHRPETVK